MRVTAEPARRPGKTKVLFAEPLEGANFARDASGRITISFVADDIYTRAAKQRFSVTLMESDLELLRGAVTS